jgi:Fur family ferric uptake transcriptional regulator
MPRSADNREALAERLGSAGLRASANRVLVLEELAREPDDATAQALHKRLTDRGEAVGLATVYRALGAMSEAGVVDALPHGTNETCYRLCGQAHHHHLVCESCHRVVELTGCPAEDWIARRARKEGFSVTGHRLEVTGLCSTCRQSPTPT